MRRTVVVTGGTGGIGRAVAMELARRGDRVLIVGRSADRGAAVLAALEEAGPGAGHALVRADLALLRETARAAGEIAGQADAGCGWPAARSSPTICSPSSWPSGCGAAGSRSPTSFLA